MLKTPITHILIGVFSLGVTIGSHAGETSYICEVRHIYSVDEQGGLEMSGWNKEMKGSKFSVSRLTGEILGEVLPTLFAKSFWVSNAGSDEWSFRAFADFGQSGIQTIDIFEYLDAKSKPFVAASMGGAGIVTGLCQ